MHDFKIEKYLLPNESFRRITKIKMSGGIANMLYLTEACKVKELAIIKNTSQKSNITFLPPPAIRSRKRQAEINKNEAPRAVPRLRSGWIVDGERSRTKARGFFERNTERPLPIRGLKAAVLRPRMYKP